MNLLSEYQEMIVIHLITIFQCLYSTMKSGKYNFISDIRKFDKEIKSDDFETGKLSFSKNIYLQCDIIYLHPHWC